MTRNCSHISEAFWGEEFNSKDGYSAVNKRMREIIEVCRALSVIIHQRAKAEDDYGKNVQKIVKPTEKDSLCLEIGKLRSAIDSFRMNCDKVANEHLSAGKELQDVADRLQKYSDKLKADWSVEKEKMKKTIAEKQKLFDKVQNTKKTYMERFKDAEAANYKAKAVAGGLNPKDVEKAVKNQEDTKLRAERADQAYREAVRQLDEMRDKWEKDLYRYYEFCEECDKQRIKMLQNEMWMLSNISSSTYVEADKCCEDLRGVLEKIVPEADIKEFVEKNQTGSKKPAPIPYESCHSDFGGSSSTTLVPSSKLLPPPPGPPCLPILPAGNPRVMNGIRY